MAKFYVAHFNFLRKNKLQPTHFLGMEEREREREGGGGGDSTNIITLQQNSNKIITKWQTHFEFWYDNVHNYDIQWNLCKDDRVSLFILSHTTVLFFHRICCYIWYVFSFFFGLRLLCVGLRPFRVFFFRNTRSVPHSRVFFVQAS